MALKEGHQQLREIGQADSLLILYGKILLANLCD
jgi:hypothetical protein